MRLFKAIGKCVNITIRTILQNSYNLKSHNIITIYNIFSENPRPLSVLRVTFPITFYLILTFFHNAFRNIPCTFSHTPTTKACIEHNFVVQCYIVGEQRFIPAAPNNC